MSDDNSNPGVTILAIVIAAILIIGAFVFLSNGNLGGGGASDVNIEVPDAITIDGDGN